MPRLTTVTRAEELANKVLYALDVENKEADAALSELVADANSWKHAAEQLSKLHNSVVYERDKLRADAEALAEKYAACQEAAATLAALVQDKYDEIDVLKTDAEALAEALEAYFTWTARYVPDAKGLAPPLGALVKYRGEK